VGWNTCIARDKAASERPAVAFLSHPHGVAFPPLLRQIERVNERKVRLFIKPYCGWCHKAMNWLDDHDVEYESLDVISDDAAYREMVKLSGQQLAPVIEVDGKVLADFGPDQLARFWKQLYPQET
jgi:glutaredoxin 3